MLILGTFAKLRNIIISFVMSVRPSVRMEQLGYHRTDFHEMRSYFLNLSRKFRFY